MGTQESNVQVPPNSTGGIVRMLQLTVLDSGVPTTVLMQVIQIADEFGNPLSFEESQQIARETLDEIRAVRLGIQEIISAGATKDHMINLIDIARELRDSTDNPFVDTE